MSDEESVDTTKEASRELFEERTANATAVAPEEDSRVENSNVVEEANFFLIDDASDKDSDEEEGQSVAEKPPKEPNEEWCIGGYDEGCEDFMTCGGQGCLRCQF